MVEKVIIVRGGGDIASGVIQKLHRSGFKVLVLEINKPTSIRRKVSFSEAIFDNVVSIENVTAVHVENLEEILTCWEKDQVPVAIDPTGTYIDILKPEIVVDAILAKKNMGTYMSLAPITIALGPGFEVGKDVNVVIETNRGHDLGRLILDGSAAKNTGVPGEIGGYSKERVIYSPRDGVIKNVKEIGDIVNKEDVIAVVDNIDIKATIDGVLRGLIRHNSRVCRGLKIADIDPRLTEINNCYTISDKARNIGGAVLEAILYMKKLRGNNSGGENIKTDL